MKFLISIVILLCLSFKALPQEKTILDTIPKPMTSQGELAPVQPMLMEHFNLSAKLTLIDPTLFTMPLFKDYNKVLDLKKAFTFQSTTNTNFDYRYSFIPFLSYGQVFNEATYKLNNRFSFGGNSFGARSVFDAPSMNSSVQNMSTKGASMFMEYKVSKNFKIETRVSVTNHSSPW